MHILLYVHTAHTILACIQFFPQYPETFFPLPTSSTLLTPQQPSFAVHFLSRKCSRITPSRCVCIAVGGMLYIITAAGGRPCKQAERVNGAKKTPLPFVYNWISFLYEMTFCRLTHIQARRQGNRRRREEVEETTTIWGRIASSVCCPCSKEGAQRRSEGSVVIWEQIFALNMKNVPYDVNKRWDTNQEIWGGLQAVLIKRNQTWIFRF